MNNTYIILVLIFTNIIMAGYIYYNSGQNTTLTTPSFMGGEPIATGSIFESEEAIIVNEEKTTLDEAISSDFHLYEVFHKVEVSEEENVFDDFYNSFLALNSYEEYKVYKEKYPSLLPVIYAAKMKDKETYLKFYNFIFSTVLEENIPRYIQDLKDIGGEDLDGEELREPFMSLIESQYEIISTGENPFSLNLGHGPIHIALTGDSLDEANNNCDIGDISSVDDLSKQECYNYVLHYRATKENNYCDLLFGEYDLAVCESFLNSARIN